MDVSSITSDKEWLSVKRKQWFTSSSADALILVQALLNKTLAVSPGTIELGGPSIDSGSIIFSKIDQDKDWDFVDNDGVFNVFQSKSHALWKKHMSVTVGDFTCSLNSYFDPWATVTKILIPPAEDSVFESSIPQGIKVPPIEDYSLMERFRKA